MLWCDADTLTLPLHPYCSLSPHQPWTRMPTIEYRRQSQSCLVTCEFSLYLCYLYFANYWLCCKCSRVCTTAHLFYWPPLSCQTQAFKLPPHPPTMTTTIVNSQVSFPFPTYAHSLTFMPTCTFIHIHTHIHPSTCPSTCIPICIPIHPLAHPSDDSHPTWHHLTMMTTPSIIWWRGQQPPTPVSSLMDNNNGNDDSHPTQRRPPHPASLDDNDNNSQPQHCL